MGPASRTLDAGALGRATDQQNDVRVVDLVAVVVLQSVILVPIALTQPIDGDEGFYSLAAKLVAHHHVLYSDFWYQQAPLLPYVYGLWQKLFGQSWYSLRLLSCCCTVALGVLLYRHVARHLSSRWLAAGAVTVYASAPLVSKYFLLIKTYALSSLLLFVGFMLVSSSALAEDEGPDALRWACAGLFAGLAADVRFVLAPAILVFLYYAVRSRSSSGHGQRVGATIGGLVVGLGPSIYFLARGPARFVNDTLVSQTTRSDLTLGAAINQKLRVVGAVLSTPHVFIGAIAIGTVVAVVVRRRQRIPMAIASVAVLSVANLIPTPSFAQYFSIITPFMVVGAIELVPLVRVVMPDSNSFQLMRILSAVGVAAMVLSLVPSAFAFDTTNQSRAVFDRPSNVRTVSRDINEITRTNEVVLSTWPGWLYETHTQPLPGTESDFIPRVAGSSDLSASQMRRYRMITFAEIAQVIRSGQVRVVVVGYGFASSLLFRLLLARSGYREWRIVDGAHIYTHIAG